MVNEWKDWAAKQTYTDGYKEDPRLTGSIWSYKALDPNVAGNVLMDCTMDEGEPEYTVSYRYYEQTGYFQKKYININSYNEGKIEPFGKQMFPGISSQTSQQLLQIADLIHIRFADVLLMQSELKQDATGLNKVRAAPTWLRWLLPGSHQAGTPLGTCIRVHPLVGYPSLVGSFA
mgnify:FL=1